MKQKKKRSFKDRLPEIFFAAAFLVGFSVFIYPTVSEQWNKYRQQRLITEYTNAVETIDTENLDGEWAAAEAFNNSMTFDVFGGDAFSGEEDETGDTEYGKVLNVAGDGIMGYISIPVINQRLPIYHGTSEEVLQKGAGHLAGTNLPVGGKGNQCVLAAHRGLPSARLFTDLDKMKPGDRFYIHVLDQTFAYEADQILPMVDKDDRDALRSAMQQEAGADYVTLFTCTPYGVNSHRLLVRGRRTEYNGEEEVKSTPVETMLRSVEDYYMLYVFLGIAVFLSIVLLLKGMGRRKDRRRNDEEQRKE